MYHKSIKTFFYVFYLQMNVFNIYAFIHTGCSKKTDTQFYFWDNFGNSALILTILSLLQAEIYDA